MKKRIIFSVLFIFLFALNVEASMVSFSIIETGLPPNGERNRHSVLWENAFMDVFFNAGYIVSNYPMKRLAARPENIIDAVFDLGEAVEVGINYVVITLLEFTSGLQAPQNITFYIFKVSEHRVTYERTISGRSYNSEREQTDHLRTTIRELLQFINNL
jgi:hypothetical protein